MPHTEALHTLLSSFQLGDMRLDYLLDNRTGAVGMRLLPDALAHLAVEKDCRLEPLVQVKVVGDDYPDGFSMGRTMRDGKSVRRLVYAGQKTTHTDSMTRIATTLRDPERGFVYVHQVQHPDGAPYLTVRTTFRNPSDEPAMLEMLSSFTLGGLTPFAADDAPETLALYRIRSSWSAEGRLVREPIEQTHLERSWLGTSAVFDRWGQVGSMPVRAYFPLAGVEDQTTGVMWGVKLTHASSWQLEAGRKDNGFTLSGGLADREFGHWMKRVEPGASFVTPEAILTVCAGDADELCQRLNACTADRLSVPASEETLPVIFNELCTTWGTPQEDAIAAIAEKLKGLGVGYFVIDAGWYAQTPGDWSMNAGSWEPSPFLFTRGLDDTVSRIRACGMKPGIWFEFEVTGRRDPHYQQTAWLLHRDGLPLSAGCRRFFDFRNPEVRAYLHGRVIDFLRRYGFQYVKIDYNDTLGIGVEGCESLGEGLRQQIEAVQDFFRQIREELPEVVIEVCSSGGHRLVPSFMELSSMGSFSDAHECEEIPIIAANMHRMILPRQSQIWAVLHDDFDEAMLYYKLTAGMLGRLCLSGQVQSLSEAQWAIVRRAVDFYGKAAPVIKAGWSRRYGPELASWRHPKGWQAVVRQGAEAALCVVHTFHDAPETVRVPIPQGFCVTDLCGRQGIVCAQTPRELVLTGLRDLDGIALLLTR